MTLTGYTRRRNTASTMKNLILIQVSKILKLVLRKNKIYDNANSQIVTECRPNMGPGQKVFSFDEVAVNA